MLVLLVCLLVLFSALALVSNYIDYVRSPQELYLEAQAAGPERAAVLYSRMAEKLPSLKEYGQLWSAMAAMPNPNALRTLEDLAAFQPQSPVAYESHIAMARYYSTIEAPQAQEEYKAALALNDSEALRLELALYLEKEGDDKGAYAQYHTLLAKQPDAFVGMRRTGQDPLDVAKDLNSATYYSDALETLASIDDPKALPLRAQALAGLGRYEEARTDYQSWLADNPDDADAQFGLAGVLVNLGQRDEALSIYQKVKTADSQLAQAQLLEATDPNEALSLYTNSPLPVAWWSATSMLETAGQITETLPIYARLATSDSYFADDAAYRLYVLARREGDQEMAAKGKALLDGLGPDWLAVRANGGKLVLAVSPPLQAGGTDVLERATALESIGRDDLGRLELVFAARFRTAPEIDLAMASALASKGYVLDAQAIAEKHVKDHARASLAFWQLDYPRPYPELVTAAASEFQVDPLLIWAVMREESRFDPEAISSAGARGLMQITPDTQTYVAGKMGETIQAGDAYLPKASIRMGAWYLHFLTGYFNGDLDLALAAYNGGAGSVQEWEKNPLVANRDDLIRWIGFGETREYLEGVSLTYEIYKQLYARGGK
jgi:peptidoglycan lytic transglycosylase